jgi:hypothetical protein
VGGGGGCQPLQTLSQLNMRGKHVSTTNKTGEKQIKKSWWNETLRFLLKEYFPSTFYFSTHIIYVPAYSGVVYFSKDEPVEAPSAHSESKMSVPLLRIRGDLAESKNSLTGVGVIAESDSAIWATMQRQPANCAVTTI